MVRLFAVLFFAALSSLAQGQEFQDPGPDIFAPGLIAPTEDFGSDPEPEFGAEPLPFAPNSLPDGAAASRPGEHRLRLEARLVPDGAPLEDGLIWRVFGTEPGENGEFPLFATGRGGAMTLNLAPGNYIVHAGFGRAGATKRVTVGNGNHSESLVLDAGGLRLDAVVGEDQPVSSERLSFEILQENQTGELMVIVPKVKPGGIVRLGAGTYHVISRYGAVNSVVRADIEVEAGKLTEAVMRHTGAELTLKLVSTEGGEALANTSWTVLTEVGDTVHESIGAFPSLVLAEGDYTAVASHGDQIYSRDFTVESGVNRDIEVRLSDLVEPELPAAPAQGNPPAN